MSDGRWAKERWVPPSKAKRCRLQHLILQKKHMTYNVSFELVTFSQSQARTVHGWLLLPISSMLLLGNLGSPLIRKAKYHTQTHPSQLRTGSECANSREALVEGQFMLSLALSRSFINWFVCKAAHQTEQLSVYTLVHSEDKKEKKKKKKMHAQEFFLFHRKVRYVES